jgi:hypothetical protein
MDLGEDDSSYIHKAGSTTNISSWKDEKVMSYELLAKDSGQNLCDG